MRKGILTISSLGTFVAVALSATLLPLSVKTGLWQMTETLKWTGLPPQMAAMANAPARHYQTCVKTEDLNTNPWAAGSGEDCTWTVLSSTGTDMEVRGTSCGMGKEMGMTSEVHGKIHVLDSKSGTGSFEFTMTGNGQTINGHGSYTGKWVGSSCTAN